MPKKNKDHAHIVIPYWLQRDLKAALKRRAEIAAASGQLTPTSFSGWVREKAQETVQAFKLTQ